MLQLQKQQQHESGNIINNNCSPRWVCLSLSVCVCVRQQTSDSDSDRDVFEYCKNLMKCNHLENPANTFIVIASCYNSAPTMAQGEPKRRGGRRAGSRKPCQWLNWHTVHVVHMLPLGNTFVSPFLFVTNLQFRFFTLFKFIWHPPISHRLPPLLPLPQNY